MSGGVVWLAGVPGSGKTTVARGLIGELQSRGRVTLWLDSDDLRALLTPEARYDRADRDRFYAAVGHLARLGAEGGALVVVSATAVHARYRRTVREALPEGRFVEVVLECAPEVLRSTRDVKGLYRGAASGEVVHLPGVAVPFEASPGAELVIDTSALGPPTLVAGILAWLARERRQLLVNG